MEKMNKYMMVHQNPGIDCDEVQSNWRKLAKIETAIWVRTYFNTEMSIRYCLWLAPDEEVLKQIFTEIGISWESIVQVEETVPDLWGDKWEEHLRADAVADNIPL
jgi:hypothetical protein